MEKTIILELLAKESFDENLPRVLPERIVLSPWNEQSPEEFESNIVAFLSRLGWIAESIACRYQAKESFGKILLSIAIQAKEANQSKEKCPHCFAKVEIPPARFEIFAMEWSRLLHAHDFLNPKANQLKMYTYWQR